MIPLIFTLFLVLLFSIQSTFLELFSLGSVVPDLPLIFVVYCGIHFQKNGGIKMGVLVGFIQDNLSGGLLGINTLSKGLIGLFFSALKDKILVEGILPISYFLFVASLIDVIIYFTTTISLMGAQTQMDSLFYHVAFFGIYNAVTGLFLFHVLDRFRKWLYRKFPNQIFQSI